MVGLADLLSVLLTLQEIKVDCLVDEMEQVYRDVGTISRMVLGRKSEELWRMSWTALPKRTT